MTAAPNAAKIAETMKAQDAKAPKLPDYKVMEELKEFLPTLSVDESAELEKSIKAEGVRDPIVIWDEKNVIVDGHNRWGVCQKLGIVPPEKRISFNDVDAVREWMMRNQLGRRNLTPDTFKYFLGKLYNTLKQKSETNVGGARKKQEEQTSEVLAKQYGVSEKTVRRAGTSAAGLDRLEKLKGKLAKEKHLTGEEKYTEAELSTISKVKNDKVAKKVVDKIDTFKAEEKKERAAQRKAAKEAAPKPEAKKYGVVFCQPDFENNPNLNTIPRPSLDKDAVVYMQVEDYHLAEAMKLIDKWGLEYECNFIFWNNEKEPGTFSKITHSHLIVAVKGATVGVKKGDEAASVQMVNGVRQTAMLKMIELYHPKEKKLDMRKGRTQGGWDAPA